jgi:hypothetical protein
MGSADTGFKNRRTGLTLFGVVAIVIGGFWGLFAVLAPLSALAVGSGVMSAGDTMPSLRSVVAGSLLYAGIAAVFIWAGVGSVRLRRWCRPIMVTLSWTWLLSGLVGLVFWILVLPDLPQAIQAAQPSEPPLESDVVLAVSLIASAIILVVYVALPIAFLWFYHDRSVRATLEAHDPGPAWTDRCPLPILALSLSLVALGVSALTGLAYGIFPVFGVLLSGAPAAGAIVLLAAVCVWLARETYRLRMSGWWGTVLLTLLIVASGVVTLTTTDLATLYRAAGFPQEEIDLLARLGGAGGGTTMLVLILLGAGTLAYMIYARRYFAHAPGPEPPGSE